MDSGNNAKLEDMLDFTALVAKISDKSGLTRAQVQLVLKELTATVGGALREGQAVRIARFGTLRAKDAPLSAGSKRIAFNAAKHLKDMSFGG